MSIKRKYYDDLNKCKDGINAIERECDVNDLKYCGIEIWPIIRESIHRGVDLSNGQKETIKQHEYSNVIFLIKYYRIALYYLRKVNEIIQILINTIKNRKYLNELRKKCPVDILFYSRFVDLTDLVDGKYYDRYIDPMADFVKGKYRYLKIEFEPKYERREPRYEPTCYILNKKTLNLQSFKLFIKKKVNDCL